MLFFFSEISNLAIFYPCRLALVPVPLVKPGHASGGSTTGPKEGGSPGRLKDTFLRWMLWEGKIHLKTMDSLNGNVIRWKKYGPFLVVPLSEISPISPPKEVVKVGFSNSMGICYFPGVSMTSHQWHPGFEWTVFFLGVVSCGKLRNGYSHIWKLTHFQN